MGAFGKKSELGGIFMMGLVLQSEKEEEEETGVGEGGEGRRGSNKGYVSMMVMEASSI